MVPMQEGVGQNERRAALLLHALSEGDRTWMLEQLPQRERTTLVSMLEELSLLGIPQDASLVHELDTRCGSDAPKSDSPREVVAGAQAVVLARILTGEPNELLARLLDLGPWPWERELLAVLGPARILSIEHARRRYSGACPDRLASALIRSVSRQISHGRWVEDGA